MSCKGSGPCVMSASAGIDRGRVGERLQAALAGLQELRFLKEKQGDLVNWALRMDRVEPVCFNGTVTSTDGPRQGSEEQRLEATLTALKQQLSRLRRQDVGLKSHLQQLDQQISELKMDVGKVSTEQLSDSRPSSGFYELSDAGSCSLSNSCTSVYSECLSSSLTSLPPPPPPPPPPHPEAPRRLSADETVAQPGPHPRGAGLHLGSSRIRARQRPVSTGDLDRMLTPGLTYYKSVDVKKPSLGPNLRTCSVDPKFQNNLVSRSGAEVYHYPSPLHAVALQSPIFSLGGEPAAPVTPESQGPPAERGEACRRGREGPEARPPGYIDQLLRRSVSKINFQSEVGRERGNAAPDYPRGPGGVGALRPDEPQAPPAVRPDLAPSDGTRPPAAQPNPNQEVRYCRPPPTPRGPETSYRYSYPASMRELNPTAATPACGDAPERARPDQGACEQRASARGSGAEEAQGPAGGPGHDFVRARFVPAGAQRVKVRQADRKTRAVKLRRRSAAEKRPQQGHAPSSNERSREAAAGAAAVRGGREPRAPGKGGASQRAAEERGRSGSEASLWGPGASHSQRVRPQEAPQPGRGRRAQGPEPEPPAEPRRRSQRAPRWPSDVEMFQAACVQRSREPGSRSAPGRATPHSAHWGGPPPPPPRALPPSSSSYFSSLNARYPPAPPARRPARCESEYSGECASLFHSTIAESSEGERSDGTVNRFGGSESSRSSRSPSETDGSLSPDEGGPAEGSEEEEGAAGGGLVWAEATLGPPTAGLLPLQLPRPEHPTCRIKASRALKKKIRRFQPASMKVMTLV